MSNLSSDLPSWIESQTPQVTFLSNICHIVRLDVPGGEIGEGSAGVRPFHALLDEHKVLCNHAIVSRYHLLVIMCQLVLRNS